MWQFIKTTHNQGNWKHKHFENLILKWNENGKAPFSDDDLLHNCIIYLLMFRIPFQEKTFYWKGSKPAGWMICCVWVRGGNVLTMHLEVSMNFGNLCAMGDLAVRHFSSWKLWLWPKFITPIEPCLALWKFLEIFNISTVGWLKMPYVLDIGYNRKEEKLDMHPDLPC